MEPGQQIDWKQTGIVIGAVLGGLTLLSKLMSWRLVRGLLDQFKRFFHWLIRVPYKKEIEAAANHNVKVNELETLVKRIERDLEMIGESVTTEIARIGLALDSAVNSNREAINELRDTLADAMEDVAESQRGTNRILQSVVTLDPKKISEALIQSALRSDEQIEDRRLRRSRGDRPGEEPMGPERRNRPRTREE